MTGRDFKLRCKLLSILPYMWIYKLLAFIVMPNKNHKESRVLFVNEAKKLYQKEFKKWFQLTSEIVPLLKIFRQMEIKIPTIYIMGDQDYMFLPSVAKVVTIHKENPYWFDVFLDKLYKSNPENLSIVDDHKHMDQTSEAELIDEAEDTMTILRKNIDKKDTEVDKKKLTSLMGTLYNEALHIDV